MANIKGEGSDSAYYSKEEKFRIKNGTLFIGNDVQWRAKCEEVRKRTAEAIARRLIEDAERIEEFHRQTRGKYRSDHREESERRDDA